MVRQHAMGEKEKEKKKERERAARHFPSSVLLCGVGHRLWPWAVGKAVGGGDRVPLRNQKWGGGEKEEGRKKNFLFW